MKKLHLNQEQTGSFCRALAQLYHAGICTGDALALLAEDALPPEEKDLLLAMSRQADEGQSLAEIFRAAGCFPSYMCSLMEVGEKVGRIENTLNALADYYEGRARMELRIKNALLYPSILLLVLLAVIVILLVWVLPVFDDVYARLGADMSGVAGGLLAFGDVLRKIMPALCAILVAVVIFMGLLSSVRSFRQKVLASWKQRYGDKGVHGKINTARFLQALAMGMTSGLSDREAAELATRLSEDGGGFQTRCEACLSLLASGESLVRSLRETDFLERAQGRLLEAGIRGGNGEQMMEKIALHSLEESEQALEVVTGRIEPTVVVVMSVLVGAILLSVMLPLVHIMTAIG